MNLCLPVSFSSSSSGVRHASVLLLLQVAYMDPGNWATAIEAGSRFGYQLVRGEGAKKGVSAYRVWGRWV